MDDIPLYQALIEQEELDAVTDALRLGKLGMGAVVGDFEQAVHKVIDGDSRYVAAVSTGHAALHLSLLIAGVGPGDEVITPSLAHLADVQAIKAVGAEPVFCDIEDATVCIDVDRAAELVGPRTRAIVALDYGCHLCDHDALTALAEERELRIVHDAAHSFGSFSKGRPVGSFSDLCMFSFDPVKALSAIDAGVVVVRTEEELRRVHRLRRIGSSEPAELMYRNVREWTFDVQETGFRYHLSNVHAALGLAQLGKLDRIRASRQAACQRYVDNLGDTPWLRVPDTSFGEVNPFLFYVRVGDGRREDFRSKLEAFGIETGVHWHPAHRLTQFADCRQGPLSVTDAVADEIVSLPLHSGMSLDTVDRVCDVALSFPV